MHHGMIGNIWWIWQMQDPENCISVLPGDQPADNTANLKWVGGGAAKAAKTKQQRHGI